MKLRHKVGITAAVVVLASGAYVGLRNMDEATTAVNYPQVVPSLPSSLSGPADVYPDVNLTPGATNPDVTQETIGQTICNPGWSTKSIRPAVSYTSPLKIKQITQYGYTDTTPADYEEDHLISLELGGNPTDPSNLWPEPYHSSIPDGGAKNKDSVENYLHKQVCNGAITLIEAQQAITVDWYAVLKSMNNNLGATTPISNNDPDDN